jgi:transposase
MRTETGPNGSADKHANEIRRQTRRDFSAEVKIRILVDGQRGESSVSEFYRREHIVASLRHKR